MRSITFILLLIASKLILSQSSSINIAVTIDPPFDRITLDFRSNSDSITKTTVKILNSKKNCVKYELIKKWANQNQHFINISQLMPGNYTCVIYIGKEEIYKKGFFKDAVFMEPHTQPVIENKPKNE